MCPLVILIKFAEFTRRFDPLLIGNMLVVINGQTLLDPSLSALFKLSLASLDALVGFESILQFSKESGTNVLSSSRVK